MAFILFLWFAGYRLEWAIFWDSVGIALDYAPIFVVCFVATPNTPFRHFVPTALAAVDYFSDEKLLHSITDNSESICCFLIS